MLLYNNMKIKNIKLKNNLFLAPMAGYTDVGFRALCKSYGAGLTTTEMVSAKALSMGSKKTEELLYTTSLEKPSCVQLFGSEPEAFKKAIESGKIDKFDIIDINMGCPAPKIYGNGDGSFLMGNINLAREIIKTCVNSTSKPISVKFRSGVDENSINAAQFAKMCEEAGASFITVHPRTKTQGYSGKADYDIIKEVTKVVSIPVIASGDVVSKHEYDYLINECGASGVMVGRASLGKPEIFKEILKGCKLNLSLKEKIKQIEKHIKILKEFHGEKFVNMTMRKHILNYLKEFKNASKIKVDICKAETLEEMLKLLKDTRLEKA